MLLPTSADRRPLCDLQLGGLEPAVGVWSGLGRAIMASSSAAKSRSSSRREAPPSPPVPNPVIDKAPSRRAEPDEQLQFQGGELR